MEIKFQAFGNVYSICFGYKTPWFESEYFICVVREQYEQDKKVVRAELVFHS